MIQGGPNIAQVGSRTWHHPDGVCYSDLQNAKFVDPGRIPLKFQLKACEAKQFVS